MLCIAILYTRTYMCTSTVFPCIRKPYHLVFCLFEFSYRMSGVPCSLWACQRRLHALQVYQVPQWVLQRLRRVLQAGKGGYIHVSYWCSFHWRIKFRYSGTLAKMIIQGPKINGCNYRSGYFKVVYNDIKNQFHWRKEGEGIYSTDTVTDSNKACIIFHVRIAY